jgi:hypothetical protein
LVKPHATTAGVAMCTQLGRPRLPPTRQTLDRAQMRHPGGASSSSSSSSSSCCQPLPKSYGPSAATYQVRALCNGTPSTYTYTPAVCALERERVLQSTSTYSKRIHHWWPEDGKLVPKDVDSQGPSQAQGVPSQVVASSLYPFELAVSLATIPIFRESWRAADGGSEQSGVGHGRSPPQAPPRAYGTTMGTRPRTSGGFATHLWDRAKGYHSPSWKQQAHSPLRRRKQPPPLLVPQLELPRSPSLANSNSSPALPPRAARFLPASCESRETGVRG